MMKRNSHPRIHIVLADDWELRGDGSGNMRAIQFDTMRRLRNVYEDHGLKGSFNAEVMQQLAHLDRGREHQELHDLAQEWEETLRETYSRGHDVQLHVHPQWSDAVYESGRWQLRGKWSILEYSATEVREMLAGAKRYLETLLRPLNPEYRCVAFRSGSWCIAPGKDVLRVLAELGIVFDMSIVEGLFYDTQHVRLDYRQIDEPFLPYYPIMDDARRVADVPQPIVCIPTHSFRSSRASLLRVVARRIPAMQPFLLRYLAPADVSVDGGGYSRDYAREYWGKRGEHGIVVFELRVSDLAMLTFGQMRQLLRDIRGRARAVNAQIVPIVLENHTKDIGNFEPIRRFAALIAQARDIEVITATELAKNLAAGIYPIRTGNAFG